MAMFTIRVELHHATDDDYLRLHAAMQARGFSRTIVADSGARYQLPPAEYDYRGFVTHDAVLQSAKAAVASVGKTGGVLVTEATRRTWDGLPRA